MIDFSKYNGVVIITPTLEDLDKLLNFLEENSDIRWRSGAKPTEYHNWHSYDEPCILVKKEEDRYSITTGELDFLIGRYETVTASEFIASESGSLIQLFEKGVIAVQLDTEHEWKEFLEYLGSLDYHWRSGNVATKCGVWNYEYGTAVSTDGNKLTLGFASVKWHADKGYEIMNFDDMMEEVKEKENTMFERGDIVKVIDEAEDYFGQKGEYVKDNGKYYRHVVLFEDGETDMFKKDSIRFVCAAGDDECIEEHCGVFGREEGKLRVGDTVYFKNNSEGVEAEGVGTIVAIKEGGRPYLVHSDDLEEFGHDGIKPGDKYKQDNDSNWWFYRKHLSLVAPEEDFTAKVLFNRGDKVKFVGGPHGMSGIGTVLKHAKDETVLVHSPDIDGHNASSENNKNNWWFSEDKVTLVERAKEKKEEEKKEEKTMFEIGDKVKFKDRDQEGVGIVVDINTEKRSNQSYPVYSEDIVNGHDGRGFGEEDQDNRNNWWFAEEELEFVQEKKSEFKVGDVVRFEEHDGMNPGIGTIAYLDTDSLALVHSEEIAGHSGQGRADNENNWWFPLSKLTLSKKEESVAYDWVKGFKNREFEIKIRTGEERDKVLAVLEKNNIEWQSGCRATQFKPDYSFPYYFMISSYGQLAYNGSLNLDKSIDASKLDTSLVDKVDIAADFSDSDTSSYVTTDELIVHLKEYMGSALFDVEDGCISTPSIKIFTDHQDIEFHEESSFSPEGIEHLNFILAYLATPIAARGNAPEEKEVVDLVGELRKDIEELFEEECFIDDIREKLLDLVNEYE